MRRRGWCEVDREDPRVFVQGVGGIWAFLVPRWAGPHANALTRRASGSRVGARLDVGGEGLAPQVRQFTSPVGANTDATPGALANRRPCATIQRSRRR